MTIAFRIHLVAIAAILAVSTAHAQSSTWNTTTNGSWTTATNWAGDTIADGADNNADFTFNITNALNVTLGANRTIGNITFTDSTTNSHDMTISGANILTLDRTSGSPQIDVTQGNRTLTISSQISGSDGLTKLGNGTLLLSGSNNYTGTTTINGGTLTVGNASALGSSDNITINGSVGAAPSYGTVLDLGTTGLTTSASISLNANNVGRVTLLGNSTANSTFNGPVSVSTTSTGNHSQIRSDSTGSITVNGDITGNLTSGAFFFLRGGSTSLLNQVTGNVTLSGSDATLAKTEVGTWTIGAPSRTYAWGNTTLSQGTLRMGAANVLPSATVVTLGQNDANPAALDLNGFDQTVGGIQLAATPGTGTRTITSATAATLTVSTAGSTDFTYNGTLTGNLSLAKSGTGTLRLNNATNTFTGKILVSQGTLNFNAAGSLGTNPGSFTADQIALNGGTLYHSASVNMGNRGITLGAGGGSLIANNSSTFTLNGTIAGAGGLTITSFSTGNATYVLQQANTFTGNTVIAKGILSLGNASALQFSPFDTTTSIAGETNSGLRTTGSALNLGGLIGNKNLADIYTTTSGNYSSVTAITLNTVDGKNLSYSGAITGARSLVKTGNGTQTFTGALSYTGSTTVSAGTLVMNGSYTGNGSISVALGATLSGNGTIVGATTIAGSLSPGNSPGLLTFNGSLALLDSTITTMEINGTSRGTTFDAIDVIGTPGALTYNGTMNLAIGTTFSTGNYTFDLFDFVSQSNSFDFVSLTGNYTGNFTNTLGVWSATTNSGAESWTFTQSTGILNLVVVPEPSTMAIIAVGATGLGLIAARRPRRSCPREQP